MTPRDLAPGVLTSRLSLMSQLLEDLDALGEITEERLRSDRLARLALERILTQLVDLATDVNQHIASSILDRVARDYRDSFSLVADVEAVERTLADDLAPSVGLRSVLIHEYLEADLRILADAVPLARSGYAQYVQQVARWLSTRS